MDLSKHLETAAEAVKRRNYPMAVKLYSRLLSLQPDNGDARAGLRAALFKKAEAKPPSKLFAILGGGIHLLTGGLCRLCRAHGAAARAFERYLIGDPLSEAINCKLGDSLAKAGFNNAARAVYQAYADNNPRCLEACREAGALLYEAGKTEEAVVMYERALKIDPRDQASLKARKNLAAEGALKKTGIETASSSRELIKDLGTAQRLERNERLQLSKEEIAEELEFLEAQLQEDPTQQKLLIRMSEVLLMDDDLSAALQSLEQAVTLDPDNSDLVAKAGGLRLRLQQRRVEEAEARGDQAAADFASQALAEARVTEYRRQVEQNPTDLRRRFHLGEALFGMQQYDAAIAELQQAVKDPKVKGDTLLMLGQAFAAKDMDDLAMGQLQKALDVSSDTGEKGKEILYAMGCVAQNMGRTEPALAHFSRILEQDIGYRDVQRRVEALKSAT